MAKWSTLAAAALLVLPGWAAAQTLSDVTAASGTRNPGLYGTGLAWGDYDGDGRVDLYVTNWGTAVSVPANALYHNEGNGTFVDQASALGVEVKGNSADAAWADYDNDGDLDLYVVDFFAQDYLFENRGSSFAEVGRARQSIDLQKRGNSTSVAWGDYDNDGWLDLYLGKYYYDNDLYHNNGDGTFAQVLDLGVGDRRDAEQVAWVDYDSDGDLDLYVVNREQENGLFRNDVDTGGRFVDVADSLGLANREIGQCQAWGDYDNDGDLDLYVGNVGANALYRNDVSAAGRFVDVAASAGVRLVGSGWITAAAAWVDYDGDGDLDLYLAKGADKWYYGANGVQVQSQPDIFLVNNGNGTFRDATAAAGLSTTPSVHVAVGAADYDGNGAPDLYVTNGWGAGSRLFQNDAPGSRFIRVQVRGKGPQQGGSNRDGIGAQVRLYDAATRTLAAFRQIVSGPSAAEVSFGAPAGPYEVEVLFPTSGQRIRIGNLTGGGPLVEVNEP